MDFNLHHRAEYAGFDALDPFGTEAIAEIVDERRGLFWTRGLHIRRTALAFSIRVERELRDHKDAAAHVEDRAIHLALFVIKDAQDGNFAGQNFSV